MCEWRDIKEFEGIYQISNNGSVKSLERINSRGYILKEKTLNSNINSWGYKVITLHKNCFRKTVLVHRLVAEAFIPNLYKKAQVNHKSGNKLDNYVDNLEWCTGSENMIHAYKTGLRKLPIGELNPNAKLSFLEKKEIKKLKSEGLKIRDISIMYRVSKSEIYNIIKL